MSERKRKVSLKTGFSFSSGSLYEVMIAAAVANCVLDLAVDANRGYTIHEFMG